MLGWQYGKAWLTYLAQIFRLTKLPLVCYTAVFSVVTQRSSSSWGGALHFLRDDTKNGSVAD